RWRNDDGFPLCQFDQRIRRHRRDCSRRLRVGQGHGFDSTPPADLAPGSGSAIHAEKFKLR
ncbi:MAG TPA: hypothetical protein VHK70_00640, partial [Burkholderiaceae bacterium]|nr:hypothetical protein [Burkholderiaceae bacterium]